MGAIQKAIVGRFRAFQGISTNSCIPGRHKLIFCIFFCIIIFLYILGGRISVLCSFCHFLRFSVIFLKKIFYFIFYRCGSFRTGAGDRGIHYSDLIWNVANFANVFWNISARSIWDISLKSELVLRANYTRYGIKCCKTVLIIPDKL